MMVKWAAYIEYFLPALIFKLIIVNKKYFPFILHHLTIHGFVEKINFLPSFIHKQDLYWKYEDRDNIYK